jgi:hypothetical protein
MNRQTITVILGAVLSLAGVAAVASPALAQTFQAYRCADGTQFIAGFYQYDSRVHLQLDGGAVTLARRFAVFGSRYAGHGVTLKITKAGTTLRHARRPTTTCEPT